MMKLSFYHDQLIMIIVIGTVSVAEKGAMKENCDSRKSKNITQEFSCSSECETANDQKTMYNYNFNETQEECCSTCPDTRVSSGSMLLPLCSSIYWILNV
jgi:hypothetical protein